MKPELKFFPAFSKLPEDEKLQLVARLSGDPEGFREEMVKHRHPDPEIQERYQHFSENTLTNFFLPFGVATNFLINGRIYHIPMVVEESSVVAAASSAAKFWSDKGGFHTRIIGREKKGQIHFLTTEGPERLGKILTDKKPQLLESVGELTYSMVNRGGGITRIELLHKPEILDGYYQLDVSFNTVDSMGANFINSCLEALADSWKAILEKEGTHSDILMSILSNYTPGCLVECRVETEVENMKQAAEGLEADEFAERFVNAVSIARQDISRAVTHNKGIFNGIDAVVIATGNDFRAVEANGHAWAAREGVYQSLSEARIEDGMFSLTLKIPLAIGTVGGLTQAHPMAKRAIDILGRPSAEELMKIIAATGLANNFSAVKALVSIGIQKGHMRLHLSNILTQLKATAEERSRITDLFVNKTVTFSAVKGMLNSIREGRI